MAKKDKKQKKQYGMGPGQSMAMAGNTGLASFKEKDINRVQQEKRAYNEFSGRDRNERASYTDIGQEIDELASKYRRPVKIADGFGAYSDGSGRAYTPNDFNADGSFRSFTASRPTFSQVMGDAGRAFKGYNSINYDNPGQGYSPVSMQRTPGMIEQGILSPLTTMAKAALGATNDLAGKIKPLFSGTVDLFKEGLGTLNDVKQQIFMNPEKYKFMQEDEEIKDLNEKEAELKRIEELNKKIEADRKQFEDLLNISVQQDNLETPEIFRDQFTGTGQSYMDTEDNFNSRIPVGTANIPGGTPIGTANAPGGRGNFLDTINPESSREGKELFQQDNAYTSSPTAATSQIPSEAAGITALTDYFKNNIPQGFLPENYDALKEEAKQLVNQGGDYFKNNIPQGFLPENYDALKEEAKQLVNQGGEELNKANSTQREINPFSFLNPFDNIPTGVALTEALSPDSLNLSDMGLILGDTTINDLTEQGKQFYDYYTGEEGGMSTEEALKNIKVLQSEPSNVSKYGDLLLSSNSITPYNNAFNLEFANQDGATPGYGGVDGKRFASFKELDVGLREGFNRVSKIVGDGRSTKSFLDIYAPRSDNEENYDEYLKELVKRVGYTIEPEEVKDLGKAIIKQENDPEIGDRYLDYLQTNSNKIYDGIISS